MTSLKLIRIYCCIFAVFSALCFSGCGSAVLSDEHLAERSKNQFAQMKKSERLSNNASYKLLVERIGKRISHVAQVDLPGTEWEFVVFDNKEPNAFAMPGGKVGVNSGLISLANGNEDEVAAVIGHEVAHVALRHSNKRMTQSMGIALGGVLLNTAIRNKSSTDRALTTGAYSAGTTVGMVLPFSRSQEREADQRGLYYAAIAGYDPRAAISFWEKIQSGKKRKLPEFLSTHPNPGNRIEFLHANMAEALKLYRKAKHSKG